MRETLVESPTVELYKLWLRSQGNVNDYYRINGAEWLRDYHGEVNGGSMDPYVRSMVRRMEVAGLITVSRRTV